MTVFKEIERKFIVEFIPDEVKHLHSSNVKQGYICSNDSREVRCRKIDDNYYLTIKSSGNLVRDEMEIEISEEQFNSIWQTTKNAQVFKERYKLEFGNHIIDLDIFQKKLSGLILAEVEFKSLSEAEKFVKPKWFGEEVTNDQRFKNKNLASNGLPKNQF